MNFFYLSRKIPLTLIFKRIFFRLNDRLISRTPKEKIKGHVLFSYTTVPFSLLTERQFAGHTNYWESIDMVNAFLEKGYAVDIIDWHNDRFIPKKRYAYVLDIHGNLERFAPYLNKKCIKIFHITGAHWLFHNKAEYDRLYDLKQRRNVALAPRRQLPSSNNINICDFATMVGNAFTADTYAFSGKKITRVPISTTHMFPFPEKKDFESVKKKFLWFAGAGSVHKGLDLTIEAFARMPELHLTICGKIDKEILDTYNSELSRGNIEIAGFVDPGSAKFSEILRETLGIVFPSSSEGGGGGAIVAMHAALIPIVSKEASVDVGDFGFELKENTVQALMDQIQQVVALPGIELRERSQKAWEFARTNHTRKKFAAEFRNFIEMLESTTR